MTDWEGAFDPALLMPLARSHPRDLERALERLRPETDPAVRRAAGRLARTLAVTRSGCA